MKQLTLKKNMLFLVKELIWSILSDIVQSSQYISYWAGPGFLHTSRPVRSSPVQGCKNDVCYLRTVADLLQGLIENILSWKVCVDICGLEIIKNVFKMFQTLSDLGALKRDYIPEDCLSGGKVS